MNSYRTTEIAIADSLKSYLSTESRPCEVVRQNQIAEIPSYPYVSYTVTTPVAEHRGTYSEAEDGTLYRSILQTWSFTVQSDNLEEAMELGMKMVNFFKVVGLTLLADKDITVRRVTNLTARDNLLSIQYEHRNGLDVTFGLFYSVSPSDQPWRDEIETLEL